jgi:uncharacterized coiled-coil DUF342 family protein
MDQQELHAKMATALHTLNYCRREADRARRQLLERERALAAAETTYYALSEQAAAPSLHVVGC